MAAVEAASRYDVYAADECVRCDGRHICSKFPLVPRSGMEPAMAVVSAVTLARAVADSYRASALSMSSCAGSLNVAGFVVVAS
jgi:hypothetical protein